MKKRFALWLAGSTALCSLALAQPALAATEAGNQCGADGAVEVPLVSLANGTSPLPATIPADGVITSWSYTVSVSIPDEFVAFETLVVFRPTSIAKELQVIGESDNEVLAAGKQTFPTQIPVKAGDLIAGLLSVGGEEGSLLCDTKAPGDRVGLLSGPPGAPGSTVTIEEEAQGLQIPLVVSVEPDADGDGFGDETQDLCPQKAAFQSACPPDLCPQSAAIEAGCPLVTVDTIGLPKRSAVTVYVATSAQAPVHVTGTVKLGKGKTAALDGGIQTVAPGGLVPFKLTLTKAVIKKLKTLEKSRKLTLSVTASATNVAGLVSTDASSVPLVGQKKKKRRLK
jgi:hypothetical protein